jgi:two-component system, chemotaxis family, CheB/CheR fusion protein
VSSHPQNDRKDLHAENERLRAEVERLRRRVAWGERHFQEVIDHQLGFVAVLDPDGRLERTDRTARELAGLDTTEVYDKPFWESPWWTYDEGVRERIRAACRAAGRGESLRFDVDAAIEDGLLPVDFLIAPIYDEAGRVSHLVASGIDISGRRQVENLLREGRERLRLALDVGEIGVVDHDLETGRIVYDERGKNILGLADHEQTAAEVSERVHPDDREMVARHVEAALRPDEPERFQVEYRFRHPDGGTRWLAGRGRAIPGDDGKPRRYMGVVVDITHIKRAEDRLRAVNQSLEQTVERRTRDLEVANQYLREMSRTLTMAEQRERQRLSLVLHEDLQQLLYGLQMRLSVVEMQLDAPPASADETCAVILSPLNDMKALCDRAVALTRTLSVELDPPVLKNEGLCAALQWLTTHVSERYGLAVTLDCDLEGARVSRDVRLMMVQAVRELLFNIVHHAGTERARVSAGVIDGILTLLVADGGAGFDVETTRRRRQQDQAGLGLFSVEERLRFIGARVRVASQPGTGTEITITYELDAGLREQAS